MGISNRSLLRKADIALSDLTTGHGDLKPAQAKEFMRLLIKEGQLLKIATVVPMKAPKMEFPKIAFGSRILRAGVSGAALDAGDRVKPDLSHIALDSKLFKAEINIPDEVLEDNIESARLKDTIMEIGAGAISRDIDEVALEGDTHSVDTFLAQLDGVLHQATSHVVDAGGATLSTTVLGDTIREMPSEYMRDKTRMRFLTGVTAEQDYRDVLAERATLVGDDNTVKGAPVVYQGIPIVPLPMMPEDLGIGANRTSGLLLDPKNIYIGIWRNIRFELDRDVRGGNTIIVVTMRLDVKLAQEPAVVKVDDLAMT